MLDILTGFADVRPTRPPARDLGRHNRSPGRVTAAAPANSRPQRVTVTCCGVAIRTPDQDLRPSAPGTESSRATGSSLDLFGARTPQRKRVRVVLRREPEVATHVGQAEEIGGGVGAGVLVVREHVGPEKRNRQGQVAAFGCVDVALLDEGLPDPGP